ncbi:MAG: thioredoxin [Nitrospinota bacterium]
MANSTLEITDDNFDSTVLKSEMLSLVDFWAEWCAPCRIVGPIIDELAAEYGDKVNIGKVNVDENNKIATEYGIRSIPTILLFKNGKIVKQIVGVRSKEELKSEIDSNS